MPHCVYFGVGVHVEMNSKRQTYQERAERLAKTIDIAEKVIDSELESKDKQAKLIDKLIKNTSL